MTRKTRSQKFTEYVKAVAYFDTKLVQLAACWNVEERFGKSDCYSDAERAKILEADGHLQRARDIFRELWSKRIGDAVMREVGP